MNITVKIEDCLKYGSSQAVMLGYLRKNPNCTRKQIEQDTGLSDGAIRNAIKKLEYSGAIKQICTLNSRKRKIMIGVEILE